MLATQLNNLIHEKQLEQFTVIKVKKQICNTVAGQSKRVVVILELEILTPGSQVGTKIGNPTQIGADGKVPPAAGNQNANPNAGAGAGTKRPGAPASDAPPVKTMPAQTRSILTPRQSSSTYSGAPITPIASITPYQNKWTIKARVSSKTDVKTWNKPSGSGKLFSMDLIDESGEIRVTAFKDQCDAFYDKAVVGKVYYISNCSVKNANKQYSKLNNEYELTFKDQGTFELCEDDVGDIPTINYNFVSISDLAQCEKDTFIDVLGVVKSTGDLAEITTKAGKELKKKEIVLVDKSSTEVSLTLWGNNAETLDLSNAPILAAKNVRVSDFNGVTLSGGDILVNPDMDMAHELKGWWDNEGYSQQSRSISVAGARGGESGGGANVKMIGEVKMDNLGSEQGGKGDYYNTVATVTFFSKDKALYKACGKQIDEKNVCNKKVNDQGDGTYRCEKCGESKPTFAWRIMLQLNMGDSSDNIWASCFQETAEKILNTTSQELGQALEQDEERYNSIFTEVTFKTFNFRMRAKSETYNDETRVKHTIISAEEINWSAYCTKLLSEIQSLGGDVPSSIDTSLYAK